MNIFKVLANGNGSINEPNVSTFLGYLLDPYQDHGLRYMFLKNFLSEIVDDDTFKFGEYEYKVYLEQAFKDENKTVKQKEIVDIIICCYSQNTSKGKEKKFIQNSIEKSEIKHVFLIENKINSIPTKDQIKNQFENFTKSLVDLDIKCNSIFSIYITPDDDKMRKEFTEFTQNTKSRHLFWKYSNKNELYNDDIISLLKDVLRSEENFESDPINEYLKYIIKSFIQFIDCGFKSELAEKKDRKNDGSYTEYHKKLNVEFAIFEKLEHLKIELERKDDLKRYNFFIENSRPKDPALIINLQDLSIHLWAGFTSRQNVGIVISVNKGNKDSKSKLEQIATKANLTIKKPNTKESYLRIPQIPNKIDIYNYQMIYDQVLKVIEFITKYS